jgi:glycerol-3-phosphate dehydrogenase
LKYNDPASIPSRENPVVAAAASQEPDVDVVVIGGGVNGTGVARDCALRGLRVALFERHDLGFGASGNSSGMIHGGVRYLTSNPSVTRLSCLDSGYIQRIAPHLLFRIPFIMPVDRALGSRVLLTLVDAFFGAYDRFQPLKRGKPHARLSPEEARALVPDLAGELVGAVAFDEWGIDGARLCLANALDAADHRACVRVHASVESVAHGEPAPGLLLVRWRDRLDGHAGATSCRVVVNATGAWAPITAALAGLRPDAARVRPGKGVHVVFDRRLCNYAVVARAIDGRQVFLEPWQNVSVLGTTDTDFYGDLDDVCATSEEVRYLVQAIARVMPSVRSARAIGTFAAVRPTLHAWGPIPDALSREHEIVDHARHGADGVYSMIGGKLASYRIFAEQMTDVVAARLGCARACSSHTCALPGGDRPVDAARLAREAGIDAITARRLVFRHGSLAHSIAEAMRERPRTRGLVCACEGVTEAEVRHVLRVELARTVHDVARRTRFGQGPCGGMRCAQRCGAVVADELGLPPREGVAQALAFSRWAARARAAALGPAQARQEALAIASARASTGLQDGDAS